MFMQCYNREYVLIYLTVREFDTDEINYTLADKLKVKLPRNKEYLIYKSRKEVVLAC